MVHPSESSLPRAIQVAIKKYEQDLLKKYELLQKLGEGGGGEVYLAQEILQDGDGSQRGPQVALKFITMKNGQCDRATLERYVREGLILSRLLKHPNVIDIYAAGSDVKHERPFLAMQYIPHAQELTQLLNNYMSELVTTSQNRGPSSGKIQGSLVPLYLICQIIFQLASVLVRMSKGVPDAARKIRQVVHRDLKPQNILYKIKGDVITIYVIDFGIAKLLVEDEENEVGQDPRNLVTLVGTRIGSPAYMPPEQFLRQKNVETGELIGVGVWSDVYTLCAVAFELMTGHLVYDGQSVTDFDRAVGHGMSEPRHVSDYVANYDEEFVALITQGLQREPWKRPTAQQIYARMGSILKRVEAPTKSLRDADRPHITLIPQNLQPGIPPPPRLPTFEKHWQRVHTLLIALISLLVGAFGNFWYSSAAKHPEKVQKLQAAPPPPSASASVTASASPVVILETQLITKREAKPPPKSSGKTEAARDGRIYQYGVRFYGAGNCTKTKIAMTLTTEHYPDVAPAYRMLGECDLREKKFESAKEHLNTYLSFEGSKLSDLSPAAQALVKLRCQASRPPPRVFSSGGFLFPFFSLSGRVLPI